MNRGYHPDLQPWIPMVPELDVSDVGEARATAALMGRRSSPAELPPSLERYERMAPGVGENPHVPVIVFAPGARPASIPAFVYIHGGGFVMQDAASDMALPARIAAELGVLVISVDYRLAPEHRFPAAVEDCYAAVSWAADSAAEWGIDLERLGIGGVSAGGGLAAAVALMARDREGPALCFQLLDSPELDNELATPSMRAYTDTPMWNRHNALHSWAHYLGGNSAPRAASPYAAPARARDLDGLPPAHISVCEFDPLRDEGIEYAQRLTQTGTAVELHLYPGTFHGCSGAFPQAGVCRRMNQDLVEALRRGLRTSGAC